MQEDRFGAIWDEKINEQSQKSNKNIKLFKI